MFEPAYTGTALKGYSWYRLLYGITLVLVLGQMLALSMIDPTSLSTLLPGGIPSSSSSSSSSEVTQLHGEIFANSSSYESELLEASGSGSSDSNGSSGSSTWLTMMTTTLQNMETSEVNRYVWWILLLSLE